MEAKVEKKPLEGAFKSWRLRLWRIKDRRLMYYVSECTEWSQCVQSKVKKEIDLAYMVSAAFHPKSKPKANQLLIKHPALADGGMLLRFDESCNTMYSWLKVLASWSEDKKNNRIYVSIPSNFSFALWNLLNALYSHPKLITSHGLFRRETTQMRVKHMLCNDLLYETIGLDELRRTHDDVYLLSNALKYIIIMLPSSLFGDDNFDDLLQALETMNIDIIDEKQGVNDESEWDKDVEKIQREKLMKLRLIINTMYSGSKYRYRYGLIALILHLLKLITMNYRVNKMTTHAMAKIFAMCFESKQWLQSGNITNPLSRFRAIPLVKVLIYHSYFLFPVKAYKMEDIVVAEHLEAKTIEMYNLLKLTKNQKKNRLKKMLKTPPTKHFDAQQTINNIKGFNIPSYDDDDVDDIKQEIKRPRGHALQRYISVDDMDIGGYQKKQRNTEITMVKFDKKFEPIHSSRTRYGPSPGLIRSLSIVAVKRRGISDTETPRISPNREWNVVHQNKIESLSEPCYYNDGTNECIYLICNDNTCWLYDIKQNQYKSFTQYPQTLHFDYFTVSMDVNDERIFIISANAQLIVLQNVQYNDADSDSEYLWNDYNVSIRNIPKIGDNAASLFIASDIGELHVIGGKLNNIHLKWDEYNERMTRVCKIDLFSGIEGHRLLFLPNDGLLLLIGGYIKFVAEKAFEYTNQILCYDIIKSKQWSAFKSKDEKEIKLPHNLAYFGACLYMNVFVIVFGGRSNDHNKMNDIYYLNLNTMKWKKSTVLCPVKARGFYAIINDDNDTIHLFQREANKHYMISVYDIIPKDLCQLAMAEMKQKYENTGDIGVIGSTAPSYAEININETKGIEPSSASLSEKQSNIGVIERTVPSYAYKKRKETKERIEYSNGNAETVKAKPETTKTNQYNNRESVSISSSISPKPKEYEETDKKSENESNNVVTNKENENEDNYVDVNAYENGNNVDDYDDDTQVQQEGFNCNVLYGWFAGLCGLSTAQVSTQNDANYTMMRSNSYDDYQQNQYDDNNNDYDVYNN